MLSIRSRDDPGVAESLEHLGSDGPVDVVVVDEQDLERMPSGEVRVDRAALQRHWTLLAVRERDQGGVEDVCLGRTTGHDRRVGNLETVDCLGELDRAGQVDELEEGMRSAPSGMEPAEMGC